MVFNSERALSFVKVNWVAISQEDQLKWQHARKIVRSNDHGSWGANFFFHGEAIKQIFPSLETPRQVYEAQYKKIRRLVMWAVKKIEKADYNKNIKVLGFGHENYWGVALDLYFKDHTIGNCQSIVIDVDRGEVVLRKRGNWQALAK
jgi:hypothetical protein